MKAGKKRKEMEMVGRAWSFERIAVSRRLVRTDAGLRCRSRGPSARRRSLLLYEGPKRLPMFFFYLWVFVKTVAIGCWGIEVSGFMLSVIKYINLDSVSSS